MAKFIWRLQRILDVKRKQEQAIRLELLHLTEQVARARCQLMMRRQRLKAMLERVARVSPKERIAQQALAMECAEGSQARIKALEEQVKRVQALKKTKTEEVLALKQATEGLERLRARAELRFSENQDKIEQKMADEMTLLKQVRHMTV